eukprot:6061121-Amphidinium_carterae.1
MLKVSNAEQPQDVHLDAFATPIHTLAVLSSDGEVQTDCSNATFIPSPRVAHSIGTSGDFNDMWAHEVLLNNRPCLASSRPLSNTGQTCDS